MKTLLTLKDNFSVEVDSGYRKKDRNRELAAKT